MSLYDEFFVIISYFEKMGIRYAVIGGIALAFHNRPRFTEDIDVLINPTDIDNARLALSRIGYRETAKPWTFNNTNLTLHRFMKIERDDEFMVDVLLANSEDQRAIVDNALRIDSASGPVRVATRSDIALLKSLRNSDQDKVDIKELQNDQNRKDRQDDQ